MSYGFKARATLALVLLVGAPSVALGDTAAPTAEAKAGMDDEVTLKDGGTLRGIVTSVEPGKSVKVLVAGEKEVRTLVWASVADVEKGKYTPIAKVAPASAGKGYGTAKPKPKPKPTHADPPPEGPEPSVGSTARSDNPPKVQPKAQTPEPDRPFEKRTVRVHVDAPAPASLMRVTTTPAGASSQSGAKPEKVCEAPCDTEVEVDGGDRFYADGSFPSTNQVTLHDVPPEQTAVVRVKPGSMGRRIGGAIAIGGGAVLGGIGVGVLTVDYLECYEGCPLEEALSQTDRAIGGTMVSLGIAGIVGGVILVATSGSSASVGDGTGPTARPWIGAPSGAARGGLPTSSTLMSGPVVGGIEGSF